MENFLTQVMTSHGYLALIIFAFIEACCIPISSEITFAFAGVIAFTHPDKFTLGAVIVIGTLAEMGGSLTSYAIGRRGGRHLLDRYGKWVLISHSDLDRAESFFDGRGCARTAARAVLRIIRGRRRRDSTAPLHDLQPDRHRGLGDRTDPPRLQPRLDRGQVLQVVLARRHHPGGRGAC